MGNHRNRFPARRRFLKQSAALSAGAVAVGTPLLALGQANPDDAQAGVPPSTPPSPLQPARPRRRGNAG